MKLLTQTLTGILMLFLASAGFAQDSYKVIDPAYKTDVAEGKVEVVEIFWYGCPHCYDFEPHIKPWLAELGDDVEFKRMPGIFSEKWIPHARAYYAAIELGVLDKIHTPLFDAIHKDRKRLDTQSSLADFFAEHGVDEDAFNEAYDSEAVNGKVKKAFVAGRRYQVRGVPSIVVNGKYLISSTLAGGFENMLKVTDQLVDKEKK